MTSGHLLKFTVENGRGWGINCYVSITDVSHALKMKREPTACSERLLETMWLIQNLPNYLIDLVHDKKQFMKEINDILIHNPSYMVDEFLFLCQDLQLRNRKHSDTVRQCALHYISANEWGMYITCLLVFRCMFIYSLLLL
jgi:hypothetical protein